MQMLWPGWMDGDRKRRWWWWADMGACMHRDALNALESGANPNELTGRNAPFTIFFQCCSCLVPFVSFVFFFLIEWPLNDDLLSGDASGCMDTALNESKNVKKCHFASIWASFKQWERKKSKENLKLSRLKTWTNVWKLKQNHGFSKKIVFQRNSVKIVFFKRIFSTKLGFFQRFVLVF